MLRFYFIRHGETDWNKAGKMQGSKDIPLNETGHAQALQAAVYLKNFPITKIVSSPQIRAKTTAEIIAQEFNHAVHLEPDLRERHFGDFEGLAWEGLPRVSVHADGQHGPFDYPEGKAEPFSELTTRSQAAIERWLAEHENEVILFVAHGGVFSAINYALQSSAYARIDNAKPFEFKCDANGKWSCGPI